MEPFDAVKVFDNREFTVQRAIVSQSSDASFHCLSMVFFLKKTAT
jgi:hypothetical protein